MCCGPEPYRVCHHRCFHGFHCHPEPWNVRHSIQTLTLDPRLGAVHQVVEAAIAELHQEEEGALGVHRVPEAAADVGVAEACLRVEHHGREVGGGCSGPLRATRRCERARMAIGSWSWPD